MPPDDPAMTASDLLAEAVQDDLVQPPATSSISPGLDFDWLGDARNPFEFHLPAMADASADEDLQRLINDLLGEGDVTAPLEPLFPLPTSVGAGASVVGSADDLSENAFASL